MKAYLNGNVQMEQKPSNSNNKSKQNKNTFKDKDYTDCKRKMLQIK